VELKWRAETGQSLAQAEKKKLEKKQSSAENRTYMLPQSTNWTKETRQSRNYDKKTRRMKGSTLDVRQGEN